MEKPQPTARATLSVPQLAGLPGVSPKRRQTIIAAALSRSLPSLVLPAVAPAGSPRESATENDEIALAIAFLRECYAQKLPVVYKPVSLLQRQFRLGYGRATELARQLERIGFWQIHEQHPQQRIALLNGAFRPDGWYLAC